MKVIYSTVLPIIGGLFVEKHSLVLRLMWCVDNWDTVMKVTNIRNACTVDIYKKIS